MFCSISLLQYFILCNARPNIVYAMGMCPLLYQNVTITEYFVFEQIEETKLETNGLSIIKQPLRSKKQPTN